MGLAIVVGASGGVGLQVAVRRDLVRLSRSLGRAGVRWREPVLRRAPRSRFDLDAFPYSMLHQLRRALAYVDAGLPLVPTTDGTLSAEDEALVEQVTEHWDSHLLCHSDVDGFYVPVAFDRPLVLDDAPGGGMVGSTQGLLAELRRCAPAIGIRLADDGVLGDAELRRLRDRVGDDVVEPFDAEQTVWLVLHEACRASVASGRAIVFA